MIPHNHDHILGKIWALFSVALAGTITSIATADILPIAQLTLIVISAIAGVMNIILTIRKLRKK